MKHVENFEHHRIIIKRVIIVVSDFTLSISTERKSMKMTMIYIFGAILSALIPAAPAAGDQWISLTGANSRLEMKKQISKAVSRMVDRDQTIKYENQDSIQRAFDQEKNQVEGSWHARFEELQIAFREAVSTAGIIKKVSVKHLRHSGVYPALDAGPRIF